MLPDVDIISPFEVQFSVTVKCSSGVSVESDWAEKKAEEARQRRDHETLRLKGTLHRSQVVATKAPALWGEVRAQIEGDVATFVSAFNPSDDQWLELKKINSHRLQIRKTHFPQVSLVLEFKPGDLASISYNFNFTSSHESPPRIDEGSIYFQSGADDKLFMVEKDVRFGSLVDVSKFLLTPLFG